MQHRVDKAGFVRLCTRVLLTLLPAAILFIAANWPAQDNLSTRRTAAIEDRKAKIEFTTLSAKTDASLRGLSVVDKNVIWASGAGGIVVRTVDAGESWSVVTVPNCKQIEFRDIEAFDEKNAVILGAGSPARIYTTSDGGNTWKQRYENTDERIFFDAMSFFDEKRGVAFSDPLDRRIFLLQTKDGGVHWQKVAGVPRALKNEAGFAASGTCLIVNRVANRVLIGLGGKPADGESKSARVLISEFPFRNWVTSETTLPRSESAGIFSLSMAGEKRVVAVGGDYQAPEESQHAVAISENGGESWRAPKRNGVFGFRSCVAFSDLGGKTTNSILLATGTNGTDISLDGGDSWMPASKTGFHAIQFIPGTNQGFASGGDGRLAKFEVKID